MLSGHAAPHATLAARLEREGVSSPDLFVQHIDASARNAVILQLDQQAFAETSFLDKRVANEASARFVMPHDHLVGWTNAIAAPPKPLHFIFHAGHVGSTLISRLIESASGVLSLREPPALRELAAYHDTLAFPRPSLSAEEYEQWQATQLRLWRRGYENTRCVVVKATSVAQRIGDRLLRAAPDARAILLNMGAEPYMAAILRHSQLADLRNYADERGRRLARMIGPDGPKVQSAGEAAAMSWLAERVTQDRMLRAFPDRVMFVDFDAFLAAPSPRLGAMLAHLNIEAPTDLLSGAAQRALMAQYAKNPTREFSANHRAEALNQSRRDNAAEIKRGLAWLQAMARAYPETAAFAA